ncbi:NADH-quinone oxidoreductase subunit K [Insulibacter thermoxylanivorax]|uniref:NADH-quinone oxidoreductase subunit K n=1 Tax=Insulibacter thermoxylanivorax TaxID=2749268 RepID=A0A916VGG8_9BACL|nr:NADH-quinone oxidoreductase subunit NuoK [Insulibacter thermoxylanivorax]GFR39397.1 NADH-quinone oxidoreductase subunit K [Insulibacter thermoxylanivorax]
MNVVSPYLILAAILFCIGLYGALTKRSAIIVLLSVELMLTAVNLNLVAFSKWGPLPNLKGQIFALFNMTIAAAEVAVGIAILIAYFRSKKTTDVRSMDSLKR